MKILQIHNFYQQPGGEDMVFADEARLLEQHGHQVIQYTIHNVQVKNMDKLGLALKTIWNHDQHQKIRDLCRREKPDVAHFHNTFPLISPAAYYAVKSENIPVFQTLHNYRLLCPNAMFLRNGRICEDCLNKFLPWPGIVHACYRQSRSASCVAAIMLIVHRMMYTYIRKVDAFIALTEFSKALFIKGGIPADKIVVKPNFVMSDIPRAPDSKPNGYALFVGRLSAEKGVDMLVKAWRDIALPLHIIGDGPMRHELETMAPADVKFFGQVNQEQVLRLMSGTQALIFPSILYETFGRTIVEAFACGTPVIAAHMGAAGEIIEHGRTGLLFEPGNAADLVKKIQWVSGHPDEMRRMGRAARAEYEAKYTPERNYRALMDIYEEVRVF